MKINFSLGRVQLKSHSVQRELRIASGNVGVGLHRIANDAQTFLVKTIGKLNSIRVIDVDNGSLRSRSQSPVKQTLLGVPVVFHRLVIVQMIAREISKYSDRVFQLITPMK